MSIGVIVLGVALIASGLVLKLFSDHDRCEAGNEFRRHDLPAAFELSHRDIGHALGATDKQVAAFDVGFQEDLRELFPARDCSWF